jgi:hypothetical protein
VIKEKKAVDLHQKKLIKNPINSRKMEIKINQKSKKKKMSNQDLKYVDKNRKFQS